MRINKLMLFGAVLVAIMFAGSSFAADAAKPSDKAAAGTEKAPEVKKIPKTEHEKLYPKGHGEPIPGKRCYYDEKEGVYFCAY